MKLHVFTAILLLSPLAHATTLADSINADMASLKANDAKLAEASSAGIEASKHYDHLKNDVLPLIQSTRANYDKDVTEYNMDYGALKSAIDAHNANQCRAQACAASYNAEKAQLDSRKADIESRERLLNQRRDNLQIMYKNLSDDTQATWLKMKNSRAAYEDALTERKAIEKHLGILRAESNACQTLLKATGQGSNEALKLKCGNVQFDGDDASLPLPPPDPPSA